MPSVSSKQPTLAPPLLVKLPRELREMIYDELVLSKDLSYKVDADTVDSTIAFSSHSSSTTGALSLISKPVRQELRDRIIELTSKRLTSFHSFIASSAVSSGNVKLRQLIMITVLFALFKGS
jgi:hypothetical protein